MRTGANLSRATAALPRPGATGWTGRALTAGLVAALVLGLGCTTLKRWAYEGVDRDDWQQPALVIDSLGIRPGERIADLGAGGGYFTFRLAEATGPEGRVYAADVDEGMLEYLTKEAREKGFPQVQAVRAEPDDPKLPEPVDLLFTCNTFHHLENRVDYFRRARGYLRPGGRVAVIDFRRGRHGTPPDAIEREMKEAGFRLAAAPDYLDRQSFLIFTLAGE